MELNKHSKRLTQDESQPASQAMLYAVGLTDEDMKNLRWESQVQGMTEIPVICI